MSAQITPDLLQHFCRAIEVPIRADARWEDTDARLFDMASWLLATRRWEEGSVTGLATRIAYCAAAEHALTRSRLRYFNRKDAERDEAATIADELFAMAGLVRDRWEATREAPRGARSGA